MKLQPALKQKCSHALARAMSEVSSSELATAMSACAHNGPPLAGPLWDATAQMLVARAQDLSEANICRVLQSMYLARVPVSDLLAASLRARTAQLLDTLEAGSLATIMKTLPAAGVSVPHDSVLGRALQRRVLHMLRYETHTPPQHVSSIVQGYARTELPASSELRAAMEQRLRKAGVEPAAADRRTLAAIKQLCLFDGESAAERGSSVSHRDRVVATLEADGKALRKDSEVVRAEHASVVPGISSTATPSAAGARVPARM